MPLQRWLFPLACITVLGSEQDDTIARLERRIVEAHEDPEAHRQLGHAFQSNGDLSRAISSFRRSVELSPTSASDLLELGSALGRLGEIDEAAVVLQLAIEVQPDAAGIRMDLGVTLAQKERWQEAEASMRVAMGLGGPEAIGVVVNLARLLRMNDRHTEAVDELQYAIAVAEEPAPAHVLTSLAESLEASSRIEEAVGVREAAAHRARHGTEEAVIARGALAAALHAQYDLPEDVTRDLFLAVADDNITDASELRDALNEFPGLLNFHDEWGMSAVAVAALAGSSRSLQSLLDVGVEAPKKAVSILLQDGEHVSSISSPVALRIRHLLRRLRFQPSWTLASSFVDDALDQRVIGSIEENEVVAADPTVDLLLKFGLANSTKSDLERASTFLLEPVVNAILENPRGLDDVPAAASSALFASLRSILGWRQAYLPQALLKDVTFEHKLRAYIGVDIMSQASDGIARRFGASEITNAIEPVLKRIVLRLLQARADPSYTPTGDTSGMTALHRCAESNLASVAQSLLDARADKDSINALGQTPLDLALSHRSTNVARAILEHDATRRPSEIDVEVEALVQNERQKVLDGPSCRSLDAEPLGKCRMDMAPQEDLLESGSSCGIDQVEAASMSPSLFKEYILHRRPVLVRGAGKETWPDVIRHWSPVYLAETVGDDNFTASCIPYAKSFGRTEDLRDVSLYSFVHKELAHRETNSVGLPYYIFVPHPTEAEHPPESWGNLWAMIKKELSHHPPAVFQPGTLGLQFAGGNTQFAVGPPGSGSSPHYHTHAYNIAVAGYKRWFLYPPGQQAMSQTHPMNLGQFPEPGPAPLMCDQAPGDILYVPLDWGHAVLNLNDTISVAREFFDATQHAPFGNLLNIAARAR